MGKTLSTSAVLILGLGVFGACASPTARQILARQDPSTELPDCAYDVGGYSTPHGVDTYVRLLVDSDQIDAAGCIPNLRSNVTATCGSDKVTNWSCDGYGTAALRQFAAQFDVPAGTDIDCVAHALALNTGKEEIFCESRTFHGNPDPSDPSSP